MTKIYITYRKNNDGPYMKIFDTQDEAMEWVKSNEIEITKIDIL